MVLVNLFSSESGTTGATFTLSRSLENCKKILIIYNKQQGSYGRKTAALAEPNGKIIRLLSAAEYTVNSGKMQATELCYTCSGTTLTAVNNGYYINTGTSWGSEASQCISIYSIDGWYETADDTSGGAEQVKYTAFPNGISFTGSGIETGSVSTTALGAYCNGTSHTNSHVSSTNKIDMTNYNSITFTVGSRSAAGNGKHWVGVSTSRSNYSVDDFTETGGNGIQVTNTGDWTVDISGVSGEFYITINAWGSTGSSAIEITKIVLST